MRSVSIPDRFTPGQKFPGVLCFGGRAGSRVNWDVSERSKISYRGGETKDRSSESQFVTTPPAAALQIWYNFIPKYSYFKAELMEAVHTKTWPLFQIHQNTRYWEIHA
jgi:hypothetical protein